VGIFSRARSIVVPKEEDLFGEDFLKKLEYLAIVSRKVFAGRVRAERRTKKSGSGIEFADHREYSPGDDIRYLDWQVYGRFGRLLLKLFEEEEDLPIYLILDASSSMGLGAPRKIDYAKKLVAALCYVGLANLDRVSIVAVRDRVAATMPPARGKGRIFKVFEFLRTIKPDGVTDLGDAMRMFAAQNKRRGLSVLVSDLYDPTGFEQGINFLRFNRFEPFVLQVFDPVEVRPPLQGDLLLYDCETGEAREVTVTAKVLERYAAAHAGYRKAIEEFCVSRQVPYQAAETSVPFDDLVLRVLRRGGVVG
jgi:uncharacterized protein (DUF58 family)